MFKITKAASCVSEGTLESAMNLMEFYLPKYHGVLTEDDEIRVVHLNETDMYAHDSPVSALAGYTVEGTFLISQKRYLTIVIGNTFDSISVEAQIQVIAHELAHLCQYKTGTFKCTTNQDGSVLRKYWNNELVSEIVPTSDTKEATKQQQAEKSMPWELEAQKVFHPDALTCMDKFRSSKALIKNAFMGAYRDAKKGFSFNLPKYRLAVMVE